METKQTFGLGEIERISAVDGERGRRCGAAHGADQCGVAVMYDFEKDAGVNGRLRAEVG